MGLLYNVYGPLQVPGNVDSKVLEAVDHFHSCSTDEQGGGDVASPPKIHDQLLHLPHIDAEVPAPPAGLSRWVRAEWINDDTASDVERFFL